MEQQKEQGLFWLPSHPEQMVDGAIALDGEGGTRLTTYVELGQFGSDSGERPAIHGVLSAGHIKLVNCFATDQRTRLGTFLASDETAWYCQFAFRGGEYDGNIPNQIKSVDADIELLGDWVPEFEGIQLSRDRLTMSWPTTQPDQCTRWERGVVAVHQDIRPSWKFSRYGIEHAAVTAHTSVRVDFDQPQPWEAVLSTVLGLQALVSIAKGESVSVERTSIVEQGTPDARLGASYRSLLRRGTHQITHSELFTMQELGGIEGIARWLDVLDSQESLINPLLVDRYRQPSFITGRTSHLLIACEAYQRHRMADPNKRINNLREEILDPMLSKAGRPFGQWVGNPELWKGKVSEIRNQYGVGHLQSYGTGSAAAPDFHLINEQLYLLVVSCLLVDCEVPEETRHKVAERMRSDWNIPL